MQQHTSPPAATRPEDRAAARVWDVARTVKDPEIPVLDIAEIGILRDALVAEDGTAQVIITPTYSGCPAMDAIRADVEHALREAGYERVEVTLTLTPAWTTDWMTQEGRRKLEEYGIAPPTGSSAMGMRRGPKRLALAVRCPRCGSIETNELSRFGSTSCKALYRCASCREPFDYFKVH
ncbi:1,2-phenylacetyl-CoA epoxidase subunit PaaD [Gulosibacter sp. 10]|uniref:1,2-phenylacetyl-CoA epoxidase subunit PaaD n=1 Tax=Gulosibacter sp. 10 TaxID=1255570 RepID=UPI00097EE4F6|nr:1,2-phenylacetyl-CoA epoxidase subunit PaaD [Gulosibacter sp. 10]SJM65758.1 Phenylacetate-CoA oxygenase, PaaJ subunit [Gulosibacter sp. 10]